MELVPLNDSAQPFLPDGDLDVLLAVPTLPLPGASATLLPVPSLNAYAATSASIERSSSVSTSRLRTARPAACGRRVRRDVNSGARNHLRAMAAYLPNALGIQRAAV